MPRFSAVRAVVRSRLVIDAVLAAVIAIPALALLPWSPAGRGNAAPTVVLMLAAGTSIFLRHRWPVEAAALASIACVVAVQSRSFDPNGSSTSGAAVTVGVLLWTVVLAYRLGCWRPLRWSLVGLAFVIVATQWGDLNKNFNPFPTVLALGAWAVGWLVRSRQDLVVALNARGVELADEKQRYAAEAVRYERARIARELHDVVAHCMSIVVVQAAGGQRLDGSDPAATRQLLDDIGELARQAEADLAGLTRLLSSEPIPSQRFSRATIDQLVAHAVSAGTPVDVTITGDLDAMPSDIGAAFARVLREGLTNAIKHAPGARVAVSIAVGADDTSLVVRNEPSRTSVHAGATSVRIHGGANGLHGLAERMTELAGTLLANTTASGGWELRAIAPVDIAAELVSAALQVGHK